MVAGNEFAIVLAMVVVVLVLPVTLAARILRAERTGLGAALLAVVLQALLSGLTQPYTHGVLLALVITVAGGSAIYAVTLGTTLVRGFGVGVISTVVAVITIAILAGLFQSLAIKI